MSKYTIIRAESEVGITLRLGNTPRVRAVIKERYSDFHVNEISPDGKIVRLTSLELPKKDTDGSGDHPEILLLVSETDREKISNFQTRLEESKDGKDKAVKKEKLEIKITELDKENRTKIHRWISSTFDKLSSETVERDGDKWITIVPMTGANDRFKRRPANRAKYTHCVLYKEGIETSDAIGFISQKLAIKPNLISYAGIKDKRSKSCQRIALSNIEAGRLIGITKYKSGIKLGNFQYLPNPISLGELKGNHFKLLLKNLRFDENNMDTTTLDLDGVVSSGMEILSSLGFINYYGMQRFGSYSVSTKDVGREVMKQNWIKAFDLILAPKHNDQHWMSLAKKKWLQDRDPEEAFRILNTKYRSIESHLLHGLSRNYKRNDFVGVWNCCPRSQRLLYVHAYQSLLWNQIASYRIQEYGWLSPVVGDLVYIKNEQENEEIVELQGTVTELVMKKQQIPVQILTEQDISCGNYSIYDVLIPLIGADITYPENKVKDFISNILQQEGLDQECFSKFRPISDKPMGGYRKLIVRPENVRHELRSYFDGDCLDDLIPSDWDKLNEKKKEENKEENDAKTTEKTKLEEDQRKCLILEFSLPSSSYATMALRELLLEEKVTEPLKVEKEAEIGDEENGDKVNIEQQQEENHVDVEPVMKKTKIE